MAHKRENGQTSVTCWLDDAQIAKLEQIRSKLQEKLGFDVPRGSAIKYLLNEFKLED